MRNAAVRRVISKEAMRAAVFPPGTVIPESAITVLERLNEELGYAQ